MKFFGWRKAKQKETPVRISEGDGMPDLLAWWHSEFTREEQEHILSKYKPLVVGLEHGDTDRTQLTDIIQPDGSLGMIGSLAALATWFMSPKEDLPLARRIIDKAVSKGEGETGPILDRHFAYSRMVQVYYRDRTRDENALELAVEACQKQIALGPKASKAFLNEYQNQPLPSHIGFEQLAIIREKERDYCAAIALSQQALEQGWGGDWQKRIERCQRRLTR